MAALLAVGQKPRRDLGGLEPKFTKFMYSVGNHSQFTSSFPFQRFSHLNRDLVVKTPPT